MSLKNAKILTVAQYIHPFMDGNAMAKAACKLPQGMLDKGNEIRVFMPKFGAINERRHQLHEVIRLSGMNLIINDTDHALLIKVASIPNTRMQVYFIDNEEYFKRKAGLEDDDEVFFEDNDERALFFCRGVLETVKKLGWTPDIIHCHGWMTSFIPWLIQKEFQSEPQFEHAKLVFSVYDEETQPLDKKLAAKMDGASAEIKTALVNPTTDELQKVAIGLSDAVVKGSAKLNRNMEAAIKAAGKPTLEFHKEEAERLDAHLEFFQGVMEAALV